MDIEEIKTLTSSRAVSTRVTLYGKGTSIEITVSVGATRYDESAWPEPTCIVGGPMPLNEAQFSQLANAISALFFEYHARFGS